MSASEIIARATAVGVRLWIDGEHVRLAGPASHVATIRPDVAANKRAIMAVLRSNELRDCVGAAIAPGGGAFLPWGPTLRAVDVRRALADLRAMIDELAMLENWPHELHVDIITRAMRGPLADLMPNITHIKQRLQEHRADAAARELLAARTWHGEGLSDRRAEPDVLAKRKA